MLVYTGRGSIVEGAGDRPKLDLFELQHRLGGAIIRGGREWFGPGPGHSRKDRSLHVSIRDDGRPLYHSFSGDPDDAVRAHLGLPPRQRRMCPQAPRRANTAPPCLPAAAIDVHKYKWCSGVWDASVAASWTPAEAYLRARGIFTPPPPCLRFNASVPFGYQGGPTGPAMVAAIVGPDGSPQGLHVTYIRPDGSAKAPIEKPKRIFGGARGGAVRLARPRNGVLAVAEGIETALSFSALQDVPTCAALSAGGLADFTPPEGVETLYVAADGDDAGRAAAFRLADAQRQRRTVVIMSAPITADWNDVLRARGAANAD